MKQSKLVRAHELIDSIVDEYSLVLPDGYKRRDPKEPGRAVKEAWETQIEKIFRKRFQNQLRMIEDYLEKNPLKSGSSGNPIPIGDPETDELLLKAFIGMMADGFQQAAITHSLEISYSQYNAEALQWVDQWVDELADIIDTTTGKRLERELTNFISLEGYTIKDVIQGLESSGLDPDRAGRIAVDQVTRTFGKAEQLSGDVLAAEYPDVKVIKTWSTNNDALVCLICAPLNGRTVLIDQEYAPDIYMPGDTHRGCRCWQQSRTDILNEIELTDLEADNSQIPIPGFDEVTDA